MSQSNRQRLKARIATAPTRAQKQAPHSPRTPVTAKQLWQQEAQCIGARAVCFINVRPKKARSVQKCQLEPPTEERKHMDIMCTAKKIAECYRRAMEAGQFFENSTDPVAKNEFREIQRKWLSLARNCKCMSEEAQKPSRRSTHAPRRTPRWWERRLFICLAFSRTSSSSLDRKPATSAKVIPRSSASFRNNRSDGSQHSVWLWLTVVIAPISAIYEALGNARVMTQTDKSWRCLRSSEDFSDL